jgi:hypothetical protein
MEAFHQVLAHRPGAVFLRGPLDMWRCPLDLIQDFHGEGGLIPRTPNLTPDPDLHFPWSIEPFERVRRC